MSKASKCMFVAVQAAAAILVALPAVAAPIKITSCTPTYVATSPGRTYDVMNNLTAVGDCIDVNATGVTIHLNGFTLSGNNTGVGINILPGKSGARIEGPGTIERFNVGVADTASSSAVENGLTILDNTTGGILLSSVDGSVVADNTWIGFNGVYGVLLQNTTNSVVQDNAQINFNGNTQTGFGIWIQNNSTTATVSSNNLIVHNELNNSLNGQPSTQTIGIWVGYNGTVGACPTAFPSTGNVIVNNAVVDYNTQIGIGLQCNTAQSTSVMHNVANFNGLFDGFDGSAACATNFWDIDNFLTTNQACVK